MPIITILIWLMVWGGMYSDISAFRAERLLEGPMDFVLALRPLMPLLAVVGCLVILVRSGRITLSFGGGPVMALSAYGLIGMFFFFLSPEPFVSLYWAALFLSSVFAAWALVNREEPERQAGALMAVNVIFVSVMVLFYFAGPLWPILMGAPNPRLYQLPFGLGVQTANGVGRFAGVLALVGLSRIRHREPYLKAPWAALLAVALVSLALSQSRTAILGFVAGSLLIVLFNRKLSWLVLVIPGIFYYLYNAWFVWRFKGSFEAALVLTGRETTWRKVLAISLRSPIAGHGFHADRLMIEGEHVHMAYLHSLIQSGILGALLFTAAMAGLWWVLIKNRVPQRLAAVEGESNFLLTESVAVIGFMTARSFFESTAAFYGVDLLLLLPCMAYVQVWCRRNPPA
jgi:O-antigen ligase